MMTNLINDLMDNAKLENSAFKLQKVYFDLIQTIKGAKKVLSFLAKEQNIKILLKYKNE
jgi:signal transduction histidine kinase